GILQFSRKGRTTAFTCRAGCKERGSRKAVMPVRSSATRGSPAVLFHGLTTACFARTLSEVDWQWWGKDPRFWLRAAKRRATPKVLESSADEQPSHSCRGV